MKPMTNRLNTNEPVIAFLVVLVLFALVIIGALDVLWSQPSSTDYRGNAYGNLPRIDDADLEAPLKFLVMNGAPSYRQGVDALTYEAEKTPVFYHYLEFTDGTRPALKLGLVGMVLDTETALAELEQHFDFGSRGKTRKRFVAKFILSRVADPVGARNTRCPSTCYDSAPGDMFEPGATFEGPTGIYRKERYGFPSFFGWVWGGSYWRLVEGPGK